MDGEIKPMTRRELKDEVKAAYSYYVDRIHQLANEYGIVPGSTRQVDEDPRTKTLAAEAWTDFLRRQDQLNDKFAADHGGA